MRDAENIREVELLGVDWMGFIFWPKSKRYVSQRPAYLPTECQRVGVFVDEDIDTVCRIASDCRLDILQLHGSEHPDYLDRLRDRLAANSSLAGTRLIKAFNIATAADFAQTVAYAGLADYFLFDTKGKCVGGNGQKFDWDVLRFYTGQTSFLLSGGIGPDDADRLKTFCHPQCAGIDLNSRFESAPGLKDINQLKQFLKQL